MVYLKCTMRRARKIRCVMECFCIQLIHIPTLPTMLTVSLSTSHVSLFTFPAWYTFLLKTTRTTETNVRFTLYSSMTKCHSFTHNKVLRVGSSSSNRRIKEKKQVLHTY